MTAPDLHALYDATGLTALDVARIERAGFRVVRADARTVQPYVIPVRLDITTGQPTVRPALGDA